MKTIKFLLIISIVLVLNFLLSDFFIRWDLTAEKRYSLAPLTQELIEKLNKPLSVEVYLEGDLPVPIERFKNNIRNILDEMHAYSPKYFQYKFVNPEGNKELLEQFKKYKINPLPVRVRVSETEEVQKFIYPVVFVYYEDQIIPVNLIQGAVDLSGRINFLQAEQNMEYLLMSPVYRLLTQKRLVVAFSMGHDEPSFEKMSTIISELQNRYDVISLDIRKGQGIPNSLRFYPDSLQQKIKARLKDTTARGVDVLVIANPDGKFTEREKYEIDQFIMRGGRVLWILDQVNVNLQNGPTLVELKELNLDDLFFKYGFKVNYDVVQDLLSGKIDLIRSFKHGPMWSSEKWIYFPMITRFENHPVTRNIDALLLRYASTIDTLKRQGASFAPILRSSPMSRKLEGTVYIDLNKDIMYPPPPAVLKNKGNLLLGTEIKGKFNSLFQGRKIPTDSLAPQPPTSKFFKRSVVESKMIVFSDGDLVLPLKIRGKEATYMPLDNKNLIINAIDYLAGDEALTQIRAREIKVRNLDVTKIEKYLLFIRIANLVFPVLLIILFGILWNYYRKKKYAK